MRWYEIVVVADVEGNQRECEIVFNVIVVSICMVVLVWWLWTRWCCKRPPVDIEGLLVGVLGIGMWLWLRWQLWSVEDQGQCR